MAPTPAAIFRAFWNGAISPELRRDPNLLRQANRVVALVAVMLIWVPIFSSVYYAFSAPICGTAVLFASIELMLPLLLLRRGKSPTLCGNIVSAIAWVTYSILAWATGGAGAPVLVWYVSIPVLSLWLSGTRSGIAWTLVSLLTITGFYVSAELGISCPNELTPFAFRVIQYAGLVGIVSCIFILVSTLKRLDYLHEAVVRRNLRAIQEHVLG